MRTARKHLHWYTARLVGGREFRREINEAETADRQRAAVQRLFARLAVLGERLRYEAANDDATIAGPAFAQGDDVVRRGEALAA